MSYVNVYGTYIGTFWTKHCFLRFWDMFLDSHNISIFLEIICGLSHKLEKIEVNLFYLS